MKRLIGMRTVIAAVAKDDIKRKAKKLVFLVLTKRQDPIPRSLNAQSPWASCLSA